MSAPQAQLAPAPAAAPGILTPAKQSWFHPKQFFIGVVICLFLLGVVFFLYHLWDTKNLAATPSS